MIQFFDFLINIQFAIDRQISKLADNYRNVDSGFGKGS